MFSIRQVVPAMIVLATAAAVPVRAQAPMEIVVNIPAGRLDVHQGGERIRSYPVSVGTAGHATPTGAAGVRRMVWNPSWTPPDSPWARDERPAAPGWNNPMGRVKIHLFEDYYVHGTPARNERYLGRPASHGCIRMRNADVMELARLVLAADGAGVSDATLDQLAANPGRTREMGLSGRVRVRIEYRLAELEQDSVALHPDVYGRAGDRYADRVRQELTALGQDATVVEQMAIRRSPGTALRIARSGPAPIRQVPGVTAPAAVEVVAVLR
ncbi:L,D-transpeptidase [Longimicrobium sp.]|uniref:L,D-transpeptidase n=1 Tax=Longimicrobium sp. TaxID=2029185 RepID=UPI003B3AF3A5